MPSEIGRLHVRRSAFISAAPERVWEEFGSFARMAAWFGRGHTLEQYEPKLGATVVLSVEIDGERRPFGGPITVMEPARELSFETNWHGPRARPVPSAITFRLTPLYDGTLVELFHHGFERLGAEAGDELAGYEAGWTTNHLDALRSVVAA